MNDTRTEIMRLAAEFILSVGYNSFSYTDISKELDVKNAAIHYYFPSKADLGGAVIEESTITFRKLTAQWNHLSCRQQLINYVHLNDRFVEMNWVCIVGALAPPYSTLPDNMQEELTKLINTIIDWLTNLLDKGLRNADFSFTEPPRTKAYMIYSTLLSSLQINKVLKNDIYRSIQSQLLTI